MAVEIQSTLRGASNINNANVRNTMNTSSKIPEHLLGYFDQQVLASYRNEPNKYIIESDYFEGELSVTNEYYAELELLGKTAEYVNIKFGYRTLRDGNLAIVAWLPDLVDKSKTHVPKWSAFHLKTPEWTTEQDDRFVNWIRRYLEGDWDVDNGPSFYLAQTIKIINGLTAELVDMPLFLHEIDETLGYPSAENTHRYQDAHKELYGYLVDGLNKECLSRLAFKLKRSIKIGDKNTVKAITTLFPTLETSSTFLSALNIISEQRRLATHGIRPTAVKFSAFSQFTKDISICLEAIKEILAVLEHEFGVEGEDAYKRHEAKKWLPKIDRQSDPHYSIVETSRMTGKLSKKLNMGSGKKCKVFTGQKL
jgi:hypothetical protein